MSCIANVRWSAPSLTPFATRWDLFRSNASSCWWPPRRSLVGPHNELLLFNKYNAALVLCITSCRAPTQSRAVFQILYSSSYFWVYPLMLFSSSAKTLFECDLFNRSGFVQVDWVHDHDFGVSFFSSPSLLGGHWEIRVLFDLMQQRHWIQPQIWWKKWMKLNEQRLELLVLIRRIAKEIFVGVEMKMMMMAKLSF